MLSRMSRHLCKATRRASPNNSALWAISSWYVRNICAYKHHSYSDTEEPEEEDVVGCLMKLYGGKMHQAYHDSSQGAKMESSHIPAKPLTPGQATSKELDGLEAMFQDLLANWARIFRRWKERDAWVDVAEFHRGLAHLFIRCSPGSGKTLNCFAHCPSPRVILYFI